MVRTRLKDLEFFETVFENIRERLEEGNLLTKVFLVIFLPIWMVNNSREPFKVKLLLEIIAFIILLPYLLFLILIFPLLLLASIILELRDITLKKMISFVPNMILVIGLLIVFESLIMLGAFTSASDQFSTLPVVQDIFGNVDTNSELYRQVTNFYLPIQAVVTLITITGYTIFFYFLFFRKREEEYLTMEEQDGVKSFIKKSFYYLPIIHIYSLVVLILFILEPLLVGVDIRVDFYIIHFLWTYIIVWLTIGLIIFVLILLITEGFVKRWFEEEVVAKVKRKKEKEEIEEMGEEEIIEEIMEPKEKEEELSDAELTEQAEELVKEEMEEKFDEEVEKRAEELVEEEMDKDNDKEEDE